MSSSKTTLEPQTRSTNLIVLVYENVCNIYFVLLGVIITQIGLKNQAIMLLFGKEFYCLKKYKQYRHCAKPLTAFGIIVKPLMQERSEGGVILLRNQITYRNKTTAFIILIKFNQQY